MWRGPRNQVGTLNVKNSPVTHSTPLQQHVQAAPNLGNLSFNKHVFVLLFMYQCGTLQKPLFLGKSDLVAGINIH